MTEALLSARVRRICLIQIGGIGDMVHALPIGMGLRAADPTRELVWVARSPTDQLLEGHPAADRVVRFRRSAGLEGLVALRRDLRAMPADLTLNMGVYFKSVWPTLFSGAPRRIGLPRAVTRDGIWVAHTHRVSGTGWIHWQDLDLGFLAALGLPTEPLEWGLDAWLAAGGNGTSPAPQAGRVGLVPVSSKRSKDWPPDRWRALADTLHERFGATTVVLGGPGPRDREVAGILARDCRYPPVSRLTDSLRNLALDLRSCELVISPDTGPLHLAHALDVPVIGLFGMTNPCRTGPARRFRDLWIDHYTEPGADPEPSAHDERPDRMQRITVDEVLKRVEHARDRYGVVAG